MYPRFSLSYNCLVDQAKGLLIEGGLNNLVHGRLNDLAVFVDLLLSAEAEGDDSAVVAANHIGSSVFHGGREVGSRPVGTVPPHNLEVVDELLREDRR